MEGDEFLRRMAKGDLKVFDELVPMLNKMALKACHDLHIFNQLKEDIVQDVTLKVFTNWQDYQGQSKLSVWIYSIAKHRCLDEMRKMKVRSEHQDHPPYQDDNNTSLGDLIADYGHSNMEQRLCIEQILAELDAQPAARKGSMRVIDLLRWIVENSPTSEELSKFLDTSVSAAKERKSNMLKYLRELCQKFCGHDECAFSKHEVN